MQSNNLLNQEQCDYASEQLKINPPFIALENINQKYGLNITQVQFKAWRNNHRIWCTAPNYRANPNKGKSLIFNEEQIRYMKEHIEDYTAEEMALRLNEIYGTNFTLGQVRNWKKKSGNTSKTIHGGWSAFKPNPHKGEKGYCIPNGESHRFGGVNSNAGNWFTYDIGSRRRRKVGRNYYWFIKDENKNWILLSRYIWEKANGPLKPGEKLKFLDGNTDNVSLENLEVVTGRIIGKCLGSRRYTQDADLTRTGILLSRLECTIEDIKKG